MCQDGVGSTILCRFYAVLVYRYRAFSHDVTAAILVFQNSSTAAMLVFQVSPLGVEPFSNVNAVFCFHIFVSLDAGHVIENAL